MPTLLLSFKRNSDSEILIHGMLAPNAGRSEKMMEQHANVCPKFGPAVRAGETIEQEIEVDTIPDFDEVSIGEWLDELLGLEEDEDEDVAGAAEDEETMAE